MNTRKAIKKIFVTDLDLCMLAPIFRDEKGGCKINPRKDLLCPELLRIANTTGYSAGYGCTHRAYGSTYANEFFPQTCLDSYITRAEFSCSEEKQDFHLKDFCSVGIKQNLDKSLKFPCLRISTPDDSSEHALKLPKEKQCGFGFDAIHAPVENKFLGETSNGGYPPLANFSMDFADKNPQLIQIAHHARAYFGNDCILEIHYFDDVKDLCESVGSVSADQLPPDTIIKSYQHCNYKSIIADVSKTPVAQINSLTRKLDSTAAIAQQLHIKPENLADNKPVPMQVSVAIFMDKKPENLPKKRKYDPKGKRAQSGSKHSTVMHMRTRSSKRSRPHI